MRFFRYYNFLIILLVTSGQILTQNLDSLFNRYVELKTGRGEESGQTILSNSPSEKCLFGLTGAVRTKFDQFTPEQQSILKVLFGRPVLETSFVSPKGFFRIHYDLKGDKAPGYNVNDFAKALDSSYIFEINVLGYPAPPPDNGNGGDDLYDVYLDNLASGTYGYTDFDFQIDGGGWTSYMVVDHKFDTHYTEGIEAASVTAAHEFHHAIQIGNYLYRDSDNFYYELTSTSMEEFVFDDVNDYYGYMDSYFLFPHESFFRINGGYELAVWNIYLKERFDKESPGLGYDIIKRSWELMPRNRAATAIAKAIQESGYTLKKELNNFGLWTFFTGDKSKPEEYFEEGQNYPSIRPLVTLEFIPPKTVWTINSEPLSNNFLLFKDFSNGFSDTLVSIITNADITSSEKSSPTNLDFVYSLLSSTQEGAVKINDFYYSIIESSNGDLFNESNIFNNEPAKPDFVREEIEFAFPQPFRYSENEVLFFPVAPDPSGEAELRIYSTGMNQVYSGLKKIMAGEKIFVQWNGRDLNNNKLPTGVYLYITKSGDNDKKGKIIIYND